MEDWLDTQIAQLPYAMIINNSFEARKSPHPFVNLLNYILLEKCGADIACTALFDSANGFERKITMRDIINNYTFPNIFKVLELSGKDIKLAIERSASYFDLVNNEITVSADFLEPKPQLSTMLYLPAFNILFTLIVFMASESVIYILTARHYKKNNYIQYV